MNTARVYIFSCSDKTYPECIGKQLFGAPSSHHGVLGVKPGDICLLYRQRMEHKKATYEKHQKALIELTFNDLKTIDAVMHRKLRDFKVPVNEGWGKQ
jgi:hypothetical protein